MATGIGTHDAKTRLGDLLVCKRDSEELTITRNGKAVTRPVEAVRQAGLRGPRAEAARRKPARRKNLPADTMQRLSTRLLVGEGRP